MSKLPIALLALALAACGTVGAGATGTTSGAGESTTTTGAMGTATTTTTSPVLAESSARTITVGGMGSEYVEPTRCVVEIGVTARRPTVEESSRAAANSAAAMRQVMIEAGVLPANIQTSSYQVGPVYGDYPYITAFETSIGYRVTFNDIEIIGQVLAAATRAGGDEVRAWGMRFEADPGGLLSAARETAWADVEGRARSLANLAGETLGEVLDVHEKVLVSTSQGMYQGGEGDSASFDIPVSPGVAGVVVLLTVTYAIGE